MCKLGVDTFVIYLRNAQYPWEFYDQKYNQNMDSTTGIVSKLAPHALLGTAIASGIVLFIPNEVATTMGVDSFRTEFRGYIGWAFILSLAIFVCWLAEAFILSKKRKANAAAKRKEIAEEGRKEKAEEEQAIREQLEAGQQLLHELTGEEKDFVAPYIFKDVTAQYASFQNGIAQSLLRKNILLPARMGEMFEFPFHIQQWALKYLKKHPEILSGHENAQVWEKSRW